MKGASGPVVIPNAMRRVMSAVIPVAMRREVPLGRSGIVAGLVSALRSPNLRTVPGLRRTAPRCVAPGMTNGTHRAVIPDAMRREPTAPSSRTPCGA